MLGRGRGKEGGVETAVMREDVHWWQEMPKSALSCSYTDVSRLGRTIAALGTLTPLIVGTVSVGSAHSRVVSEVQCSAVRCSLA
jgi:hypothetical protein